MATDKNGKLSAEIKSPGDAWMEHVEKNMGASNFTPAWMNTDQNKGVMQGQINDLNKKVDGMEKQQTMSQDVNQPNQDKQPDQQKGDSMMDKLRQDYRDKQNDPQKFQDKVKDKDQDKTPGLSR